MITLEEADKKIAEIAGRARKMIHLAGQPGMDYIAVALNSGLTYQEQKEAEGWMRALRLAEQNAGINPRELALMLYKEMQ